MPTAFALARLILLARLNPLDEDTQDQIAELAGLRDLHEKRLRELMRQQALLGRSTPAEINIEIAAIGATITKITSDMAKLQIGASKLIEQFTRAESTGDLADISKQVSALGTTVTSEVSTLINLMLYQQDNDIELRKQRQRITNTFYVVISILVLADLLLRLFW